MSSMFPNTNYSKVSTSSLWSQEDIETLIQGFQTLVKTQITIDMTPKYDEWGRPLDTSLPQPHELLEQILDPEHPENVKPSDVADVLMKYYVFKTLEDTEEVLYYYKGKYRFGGEAIIKSAVQDIMEKVGLKRKVTNYFVREVIGHIQRSTYVSRDEFDSNPYIVNCLNGLLDVENWTFKPHTPEYLSLRQINAEFNPDATPRRFLQFLGEVLGTKEDALTIMQYIGYLLLGDNRFEKILILFGSGHNGKTTLINTIIKFLGEENVLTRSPQELIESRFARADLYGKMANISDDLPYKAFKSTGLLKMLSSNTLVTAEKKFKNSFQFQNRAKLIFAANILPRAHDATEAFYRRLLLIVFPNQIPKERRDPQLEKKLTTPEELSGILNLAIFGLTALMRFNGFISDKSPEEIEEMYEKLSNPVAMFVEEFVVRDPEKWIPKEDLYAFFVDFCKQRRLPRLTRKAFSRELRILLPDIRESMKAKATGEYTHGWVGITVRPLYQNQN